MIDKAIRELTKLLIKYHPEQQEFVVRREDLVRLCIKVLKEIERNESE